MAIEYYNMWVQWDFYVIYFYSICIFFPVLLIVVWAYSCEVLLQLSVLGFFSFIYNIRMLILITPDLINLISFSLILYKYEVQKNIKLIQDEGCNKRDGWYCIEMIQFIMIIINVDSQSPSYCTEVRMWRKIHRDVWSRAPPSVHSWA